MQCRNGYVNHRETQPPLIANYEFSSTEQYFFHDVDPARRLTILCCCSCPAVTWEETERRQ